MAQIIINTPYFDQKIRQREIKLVDLLCDSEEWEEGEDKLGKPFSFATKYCCLQNIALKEDEAKGSEQYAIYDSFVAKVLTYYQEESNFLGPNVKISPSYLTTSYEKIYFPTIKKFHDLLTDQGGREISYRDLDHFLWRMGQEFFMGYKIYKCGIYVFKIEVKETLKITIFINDKKIDLKEHIIPALQKKKQNILPKSNETKHSLALRILKKLYVCVMRKEGFVGDYYIDANNSKTTKLYQKLQLINVVTKNKTQKDIMDEIVTSLKGQKIIKPNDEDYFRKSFESIINQGSCNGFDNHSTIEGQVSTHECCVVKKPSQAIHKSAKKQIKT